MELHPRTTIVIGTQMLNINVAVLFVALVSNCRIIPHHCCSD